MECVLYITMVMCSFKVFDGELNTQKKKASSIGANEMFYEIHIRQFNDEYLCVQAMLTKRGENVDCVHR